MTPAYWGATIGGVINKSATRTHETAGQRRYASRIAAVAALGGLLFGYDTGVIAGALLYLGPAFQMSAGEEGLVTSMLLAGAALGALVGGRVADVLGRRATLVVGGVIFVVGALWCAAAGTVSSLVAARGLLGLAVGGVSIVVPMYISENTHPDRRGTLVSLNSLMIVVGQLLAFGVNSVLAHSGNWRLMLGLAAVPGVILAVGMFFLPDTPAWLMRRGRRSEATKLAERLGIDVSSVAGGNNREIRRAARAALKTPWIRRAVIIAAIIGVIQQITGVNAIMYFVPTMMNRVGISTTNSVYTAILIGAVSVVACWVGLMIVDRMGRKRLLMIGLTGTTVSLVILAVTYSFADGNAVVAFVSLAMMALFIAFQQAAVSLTTWLLISEIVPVEVRGLGMGLAGLCLWVGNWAVAQAFLPLVDVVGGPASFGLFAVLGGLALIFVVRRVPETTGRSLEDVAAEMREF